MEGIRKRPVRTWQDQHGKYDKQNNKPGKNRTKGHHHYRKDGQ